VNAPSPLYNFIVGVNDPIPAAASAARFHTTQWSVVLQAGGGVVPGQREALAALCSAYWYPVYAFLRRKGRSAEDAGDLTQGFFARLIEKDVLAAADPNRGRFRSFLLKSVQHFVANQDDHDRALKRGGGAFAVPLQVDDAEGRYRLEPSHDTTPERLFERRWAVALLECVLARLRQQSAKGGDATAFDRLKVFLGGPLPEDSYAAAASDLGMTEAAVKVAVHRLRSSYSRLLREEIGRTVESSIEVEDEIRQLFAALS
jgi:DNA-directed RNA polymerase specialized sigma24 family protein